MLKCNLFPTKHSHFIILMFMVQKTSHNFIQHGLKYEETWGKPCRVEELLPWLLKVIFHFSYESQFPIAVVDTVMLFLAFEHDMLSYRITVKFPSMFFRYWIKSTTLSTLLLSVCCCVGHLNFVRSSVLPRQDACHVRDKQVTLVFEKHDIHT
jgi:hypothetical protein